MSEFKNNLLMYILIGTILLFCGFSIRLYWLYVEKCNSYILVSNELAKVDSIHRAVLNDNSILSTKYALQSKEIEKIVMLNKSLKDYLKQTESKLLTYIKLYQEFKIKDTVYILGDTLENGDLAFDTCNAYLEMSSTVRTKPPTMRINSLIFPDSATIGIIEQKDGFLKGFINNSNPYIFQKNMEFFIKLDTPIMSSTGLQWLWIPIIGAVCLIIGLLLGGL